jgi:hypothetical protein
LDTKGCYETEYRNTEGRDVQYGNIKKKRIDDEYGTSDQTPGSSFEPYLEKESPLAVFCSLKYKEVLNGRRQVRLYIVGPSTLSSSALYLAFHPLTLTSISFFFKAPNHVSLIAQPVGK